MFDGPTVQWFAHQTTLVASESDVLILLDCCAAASSVVGTGHGITEVIAACGYETEAPGVGQHSFTRSLIDELKFWDQAPLLSAAMLHHKVLSALKYWKPRYDRRVVQGGFPPREKRRTPVYILLSNETNKRSIELAPIVPETQGTLSTEPVSDSSRTASNSSSDPFEDLQSSSAASSASLSSVWPDPEFKSPKVLISVALEDDQKLDPGRWTEWITDIPAVMKSVKIEGVYQSDSTLVIASLPVAVWNLLPESSAISFIAFVRSHNLIERSTIKPVEVAVTSTNPSHTVSPAFKSSQANPPGFHMVRAPPIRELSPKRRDLRWAANMAVRNLNRNVRSSKSYRSILKFI